MKTPKMAGLSAETQFVSTYCRTLVILKSVNAFFFVLFYWREPWSSWGFQDLRESVIKSKKWPRVCVSVSMLDSFQCGSWKFCFFKYGLISYVSQIIEHISENEHFYELDTMILFCNHLRNWWRYVEGCSTIFRIETIPSTYMNRAA